MFSFLKKWTLLGFVFAASPAFADPPPDSHHHWRNTNYNDHYILYDASSRQWIETVNCRVMWRFNLLRNELNAIELHDPTRNMTIRLEYGQMLTKASGASSFSFYQNGTFDKRERFAHYQGDTLTGYIVKRHGCAWAEYFTGQSTPAFNFRMGNYNNNGVEIYDGSRNMWVRMDDQRMYLKQGNGAYGFFKMGRWY